MYDPQNWYWQDDAGRLYSSAAQSLVSSEDAAFLAWAADGNAPTRWPSDDVGVQTDAALSAVLAPYGITVATTAEGKMAALRAYAAARRFAIETGGIIVNSASVDTSIESQNRITGAYVVAQANPDAAIKFKASSGWISLTSAEMVAIGSAVGAFVQAMFAAEDALDEAIAAGTITTTAEVDAWAWPANS